MPCSLYGKLLAKRDFIAENLSRGFLDVFEPWLHGALAASRLELGARWQETYFAAPIWRFWLGEGYCGRAILGAFMPSVDGVGRSFPLVAFASAPAGHMFARPDVDPQDAWFDALEAFLLATLETRAYGDVTAALAGLPDPRHQPRAEPAAAVTVLPGGMAALRPEPGAPLLADLSAAEDAANRVHGTCWWTIGGADFPAAAVCGRQLPPAATFSSFLTGRLVPAG